MIKQELAPGIVHYIFKPEPQKHFGISITALIEGNKAVLIDTGYEHQALEVLHDLNRNNIVIDKIIITHFHDDHMQGLKVLPKVPVFGSEYFQETLNMWTEKEEHKYFTPSVRINKKFSLDFGRHRLSLTPFPGHSLCGVLVNINDEFIHIVDELIFSPKGEPILPSSDGNDMKRHLESLNRLKNYSDFTIVPSHGPIFSGQRLENEIKSRYVYLNALLGSDRVITFDEATKECDCTFLHSEWHKYNCE